MTRTHWSTSNMPRELLEYAKRVAGLRAASGMAGATTESVFIDCFIRTLPILEDEADARRLAKKGKRTK